MKRAMMWVGIVLAVVAAGWAGFQGLAQSAEVSLARVMPQGAVLFLEAKDFGALLQEWNASPEKTAWLKSDNYEVFSRSRLFLRLKDAKVEFDTAAGLPPDMKLLQEVAGTQSALAIYDIGKLEMLYITRQPSARAMQNALWQKRSQFEPRQVKGKTFYVRKDPESGRDVAFAVDGDYLILATREDLIAGALSLFAKEKLGVLADEEWFANAVKQATEPGDLRMAINLEKVAETPQFRTYWVQQNITEMQQYESTIVDLYRTDREYREERLLFGREEKAASDDDARRAAELAKLVPPEAGVFRAKAAPSAEDVVAALEQKVLTPHLGPAPVQKLAPSVSLGGGEVGSDSNLDVRIDVAPTKAPVVHGDEALKAALVKGNTRAMLELHRSEASSDGVFVKLRSTIVLSGATDWDEAAMKGAVQQLIAPGLTSGTEGVGWKQTGQGAQAYFELDGLEVIALAVRGRYVVISNDPTMIGGVLSRTKGSASDDAVLYAAGFNHARERQNFYKLTSVVDRSSRFGEGAEGEPQFFSQDVRSLSQIFASVESMSVVTKQQGEVESQTVRYKWAH